MSVFFPPPRSGGPLRATRTSEMYRQEDTAAYEFYKKQLDNVPADYHQAFNAVVDSLSSPGTKKNETNRNTIVQTAQAFTQRHHAQTHGGAASATNAKTLVSEISTVVDFIFRHNVTGDEDFKKLLRYDIRDGLDPTNRIVLCCFIPCICCGLDKPSLVQKYESFDAPVYLMLKYVLILALLLFYVLCLLWLSYGQQTLYACNQEQPSLANQGFKITDAISHSPLYCKDLLARCYIPVGRMPMETYYSVRIASYVLSTIPLLFLFASPCVLSSRMLAPLSHIKTEARTEQNIEAARHCINAILCARGDLQASDFYDISAYWMLLTHWAGGVFTLCLDISTIDYVGGLDGACQSWPNNTLAIQPMDDRCACSVLFGPADTRGLARVSPIELMSPKSVATVLMIANFVYTLWSIGFVLQVWQLRYMTNTPSPATGHAKPGSSNSAPHDEEEWVDEEDEERATRAPSQSTNSMRTGLQIKKDGRARLVASTSSPGRRGKGTSKTQPTASTTAAVQDDLRLSAHG